MYLCVFVPLWSGERMDRTYLFCPHCSAPLAQGEKFGRTRRYCRYCGFIHFVEPKVAVAALVSDGDHVLLVRRSAIPRIGYWALPAGYMDADELPEEALVREVAEETGLAVRVTGARGVAPLAGWQERRGILLLYRAPRAERRGDAGAVAGDDVSEARWFRRDEMPWDRVGLRIDCRAGRPGGPKGLAEQRPSEQTAGSRRRRPVTHKLHAVNPDLRPAAVSASFCEVNTRFNRPGRPQRRQVRGAPAVDIVVPVQPAGDRVCRVAGAQQLAHGAYHRSTRHSAVNQSSNGHAGDEPRP